MLNPPRDLLRAKFEHGMTYDQFVASGEPHGHRPPWDQRYGQLELDPEQHRLVADMTRTINLLCLTGTWCGDCALQGAALQRLAEANPEHLHLRFIPRSEEHAELITRCRINAGFRVPVTWFMAEDFHPVAVFGDRTLSRYRSMARKAFPDQAAGLVLASPPEDPVRAVLQEMLDHLERAHLLLRLSGRLREKYAD